MVSPQEHYDKHLGPVYCWMLGDMDAALAGARAELGEVGALALAPGSAIDLGAGPGAYSIPLAEAGFSVAALDTCAELLDELKRRARGLDIQTRNADLTAFRTHQPEKAGVILCMGDTLTHLPDVATVEHLLEDMTAALEPGGLLVLSFRDYVTAPLEGNARFILVRADEERTLTCFLEYGEETVTVHDILHEREGSGWAMRVSAYPKLRLDPARVEVKLRELGLETVRQPGLRGMVRITARASER